MAQTFHAVRTDNHWQVPSPSGSEASRAARYEALLRASQAISAQRDPKTVFQVLARELRLVIPFDALAIVLYDEATHQICWHGLEIIHQPGAVPAADLAPEEMITWWVYQQQQPVVIPAVATETRFPRMMARLQQYGIQSACALPLTTVHRRLGGLGLGSTQCAAYPAEEVRFLTLVAD